MGRGAHPSGPGEDPGKGLLERVPIAPVRSVASQCTHGQKSLVTMGATYALGVLSSKGLLLASGMARGRSGRAKWFSPKPNSSCRQRVFGPFPAMEKNPGFQSLKAGGADP